MIDHLPLAQAAFERMGDRFRGPGAADYGISPWALTVVMAVVAGLVLYFMRRMRAARREESCYHPRRLFQELCRAHELTRAQQRLARKIARRLNHRHPGAIFLDPAGFTQAFDMPQFLDQHDELRRLEDRIYPPDQPEPVESPAASR